MSYFYYIESDWHLTSDRMNKFVFGRLSQKKIKWAIITGMVLYSLDALIFLIFQDYRAILFHVFAFYSIFKGLKAGKELAKLQNITVEANSEPEVTVEKLV